MIRLLPFTIACAVLFAGCVDAPAPAPQDMGGIDAPSPDLVDMQRELLAVGEICTGPDQCIADAACVGTTAGQFVCMATCETPYSICANAAVCLASGSSAICYTGGQTPVGAPCSTNLDCALQALCIGAGDDFRCRLACDSQASCTDEDYCAELPTGARVCTRRLGAACLTAADCESAENECTSEVDAAFDALLPGGYCTVTGCEETPCEQGVCLTLDDAPASTCLATCSGDSDCRFTEGYRCVDSSICDAFDMPETCRQAIGFNQVCLAGF